jgi:hypothetical protein
MVANWEYKLLLPFYNLSTMQWVESRAKSTKNYSNVAEEEIAKHFPTERSEFIILPMSVRDRKMTKFGIHKFTMKTREMALAACIRPLPPIFCCCFFCFFTAGRPDYAVFTYILLTLTSGRFHWCNVC